MSTRRFTVVKCDLCGAEFVHRGDYAPAARKAAKREGWARVVLDIDTCPTCSEVSATAGATE